MSTCVNFFIHFTDGGFVYGVVGLDYSGGLLHYVKVFPVLVLHQDKTIDWSNKTRLTVALWKSLILHL